LAAHFDGAANARVSSQHFASADEDPVQDALAIVVQAQNEVVAGVRQEGLTVWSVQLDGRAGGKATGKQERY
jgi:head-tail adaptor